jgi:peptidoglycan/xylan/chitin deacetylase (PgdA/CDA1 family)
VSIGGHSWNLHHTEQARGVMVPAAMAIHPLETSFLRLLSLTQDARRVQNLIKSVTGTATPFYACPYGAYDAIYLNSLRRAGFTLVFDSFPGSVTRLSDHERLPRVDIGMRGYTFHQVFLALSRAATSLRKPPAQIGRVRDVPGADVTLPAVPTGNGMSGHPRRP